MGNYYMDKVARLAAEARAKGAGAGGGIAGVAGASNKFATGAEASYGSLGHRGNAVLDRLDATARGQNSMAAEQLRQGLQQNIAGQQSMAAGARPANAAMAARTASMNAARMGSGFAGQQAMAGIAERQAADAQLGSMLGALRGQDAQVALGGRSTAMQGELGLENARTQRAIAEMQKPSTTDKVLGLASGLGTAYFLGKK